MTTPKTTDTLETITSINRQLYEKYNRHHVLTDQNFLFDPTIDPMSYFYNIKDINGNTGTTFKVSMGSNDYVLEKLPQWAWESDEEYLTNQFDRWTNEMEVSYDLEDSNIPNTRHVHHIFIKRNYSPFWKKFYYCVWTLKEYFLGDSIMNFDYGAEYPSQYYNNSPYGKHKPGRLITLKAAKQFLTEVITVYIQLLKKGYIPYRYNDTEIIMRYENDKIEWKFVEYLYFERRNPKNDNIWNGVVNFMGPLCWRLSTYTNYSIHPLSPKQHHPFWSGLKEMVNQETKNYKEKNNEDDASWDEYISVFNKFLQYVECYKLSN